jgi:hypothetical protein
MLAPQVLEEGRLGFDTLAFLGGPAQQVPMGFGRGRLGGPGGEARDMAEDVASPRMHFRGLLCGVGGLVPCVLRAADMDLVMGFAGPGQVAGSVAAREVDWQGGTVHEYGS